MSRSASASHHPRPRMACWRQGPGSPAASARIQPVLRRSSPSSPSRNQTAEAAPPSVGHPSVDNEGQSFLAISIVTILRQRTRVALVIATADVVQDQTVFAQVTGGEFLLNAR